MKWDYNVELLVIGSGGGGMTAALTGYHHGLDVLIIEKSATYGGSTARSGGGVWIPNSYLLAQDGVEDSSEQALTYMRSIIGAEIAHDLLEAYVREAPLMVEFLRDNTVMHFQRMPGYADYYPEAPGGCAAGRSLEPLPFNGKKLGADLARLEKPPFEIPLGVSITSSDYQKIGMMMSSWRSRYHVLRVGLRWITDMIMGRKMLTMGQGLSARLRYSMMQAGIPLWHNTALKEFITENNRVVGVVAEQEGREITIAAENGVILAAGGFAQNLKMRESFQQGPLDTAWSLAHEGNTGDGIQAGIDIGADTALMDDAWWGPVSVPPGKSAFFHVGERAYPGAIMVNGSGYRFCNESAPYVDVVHSMYHLHHEDTPHIPAYFIMDARFKQKYIFGEQMPPLPFPGRFIETGYVKKASTLQELAQKIGVPAGNLEQTIARFNTFARQGIDEDFGRGKSAYDRYYGDPANKPNVNLAPLEKAPYYAIEMQPGDIGTKGGLVTDSHARVLNIDQQLIQGLYAVGNSAASIMGHTYPGAGGTIGPSMVFGYIAARHCAGK